VKHIFVSLKPASLYKYNYNLPTTKWHPNDGTQI